MNKFDRKSQQLRARVEFVRGRLHKTKGSTLKDDEADTLSDQVVSDEVDLGTLEIIDREPEADAGEKGEGQGEAQGDAQGGAAAKTKAK